MKKALLTGITGQDGAYLAEFLLRKGYEVHGIKRRASLFNTARVDHLYRDPHEQDVRFFMHYGDLTDSANLARIVQTVRPDEVYNLGAQSHVKVSFEAPEYTADADGLGTLRLLEATRLLGLDKEVRFYQASTSELYGLVRETPQTEKTPFYPRSPYGCAKLYAYWITINYREAYNMFACNGILFNHESPLRGETFVTRKITRAEPLLSHSFERVMPGRNYVSSIRDFWRVCSGINDIAREKVTAFLTAILNTDQYPLTVLDRPMESETCKIVENSYRATLLAFMDEWSVFAERNGVDITKVINAIKMRPTHNNMLFPGPGIGGYCLPKDGGLGVWAYHTLMGFEDDIFKITPQAININDTRALQPARLTRDALRNMGRIVAASKITLLGASYREDVGDTRYSGAELIVRKLTEMGAEVSVHDPYVKHWWELEKQDTYPGYFTSRVRRRCEAQHATL